MIDALAHLSHQLSRHDRLRITPPRVPAEPVNRNTSGKSHQPLDCQRIAKTACSNQAGPRTIALNDGIGRLCRAVAKCGDLGQ